MDLVFNLDQGVFNYRVAGVCMINNHILIQRGVQDSYWVLPGGRTQFFEGSEEALKREFYEELGVHVEVQQLLWIVENFFEHNSKIVHEMGLFFQVVMQDQFLFGSDVFYGKEEEEEQLQFQWVAVGDLPRYNLYPVFLKEALLELPSSPKHLIIREVER